jgi:hypothetical protein
VSGQVAGLAARASRSGCTAIIPPAVLTCTPVMAIPDYQTLMLPLLTLLADGKERSFSQVPPPLADQFELTAEDRARLLPSG